MRGINSDNFKETYQKALKEGSQRDSSFTFRVNNMFLYEDKGGD